MTRDSDFYQFKEIPMSTAEGRPMTVDPALASAAVARVIAGLAITPVPGSGEPERVIRPRSAPPGVFVVTVRSRLMTLLCRTIRRFRVSRAACGQFASAPDCGVGARRVCNGAPCGLETFEDEPHRHRAFPDRGRGPLDRPAADIADGEDPGPARFQEQGYLLPVL